MEIGQDLEVIIKECDVGKIVTPGSRYLYNADARKASDWVRLPTKGFKGGDAPQMKSGLNVGQVGRGTFIPQALLYFSNNGNSIQDSQTLAYFTSSCGSRAHGLSVLVGEGWRRSVALYSARKLSEDTWITHNDEYLAPLSDKEGYKQWVDDCHIYALLENKNNMTSMRNVEYKGKSWNIHNHFFWLTRAEAMETYSKHASARNLYRDAKSNPIPFNETNSMVKETPEWRKNGDPYFSYVLPSLDLSPLAKEILSDLNTLFVDSLPERNKADEDLHLNAWDAGIYQHNKMWKDHSSLSTRWSSLKKKHKELAEQLKHGVYTYGFLKR